MKILVSLFILLSIVTLWLGCSEETSPEPKPTIQQLWPLRLGNLWTYQRNTIQTGNVDTSIYKIVSLGDFFGTPTYTLAIDGDTTEYGGLMYENKDELYSITWTNAILDKRHLLEYPVYSSDSSVMLDYHVRESDFMRFREELILRHDKISVTTPRGTFDCVHYEDVSYMGPTDAFQDTTGIVGLYYSKNVGLVKREEFYYAPNKRTLNTTLQLVNYTLK